MGAQLSGQEPSARPGEALPGLLTAALISSWLPPGLSPRSAPAGLTRVWVDANRDPLLLPISDLSLEYSSFEQVGAARAGQEGAVRGRNATRANAVPSPCTFPQFPFPLVPATLTVWLSPSLTAGPNDASWAVRT